MSVGLYSHTTRATGSTLTAAIYNSDHQNHITNQNPSQTGAYSDNVAEMQSVVDPGGLGSESLAPHLAGELERIRFAIKRIVAKAQWYIAPDNDLSAIGSPQHFSVSKTFKATGDLTPAQINADQNDYAPTGHADAFTFRISSDAVRNITGLAGGANGRIVIFDNVGANAIQLLHESASSAAGNRFTFNSGQAPLVISAGEALMLKYDGTSSRWRAVNSGDVANPSFANGTFSGNVTIATYVDQTEMSPPANPAANNLRCFAKDSSGVTVPAWLDSAGADPTIPARAYAEYATSEFINNAIPNDDTIPQNTEGTQILSVAITLKRPNSIVRLSYDGFGAGGDGGGGGSASANGWPWAAALFRSSANALKAVASGPDLSGGINSPIAIGFSYEDTPGSAGPHTYTVRVGPLGSASGTPTLLTNGWPIGSSARLFGGAGKSVLIAEEIFI